jgi:hypothetical protein
LRDDPGVPLGERVGRREVDGCGELRSVGNGDRGTMVTDEQER